MLSVEQMNALPVSYKPGWSIVFRMGRFEGHHATIRAVLPDAYDPDKTTSLVVECFLSPNDVATEESLMAWLVYRLARLETHEAREFLRLDGVPLFDPHAEGADADL